MSKDTTAKEIGTIITGHMNAIQCTLTESKDLAVLFDNLFDFGLYLKDNISANPVELPKRLQSYNSLFCNWKLPNLELIFLMNEANMRYSEQIAEFADKPEIAIVQVIRCALLAHQVLSDKAVSTNSPLAMTLSTSPPATTPLTISSDIYGTVGQKISLPISPVSGNDTEKSRYSEATSLYGTTTVNGKRKTSSVEVIDKKYGEELKEIYDQYRKKIGAYLNNMYDKIKTQQTNTQINCLLTTYLHLKTTSDAAKRKELQEKLVNNLLFFSIVSCFEPNVIGLKKQIVNGINLWIESVTVIKSEMAEVFSFAQKNEKSESKEQKIVRDKKTDEFQVQYNQMIVHLFSQMLLNEIVKKSSDPDEVVKSDDFDLLTAGKDKTNWKNIQETYDRVKKEIIGLEGVTDVYIQTGKVDNSQIAALVSLLKSNGIAEIPVSQDKHGKLLNAEEILNSIFNYIKNFYPEMVGTLVPKLTNRIFTLLGKSKDTLKSSSTKKLGEDVNYTNTQQIAKNMKILELLKGKEFVENLFPEEATQQLTTKNGLTSPIFRESKVTTPNGKANLNGTPRFNFATTASSTTGSSSSSFSSSSTPRKK